MVSLAGLFLVNSTTIRSMAMGAIMVVAVSVLAAVTLLPVLMRLLGRRAYARGRIALVLGLIARRFRTAGRHRGSTAPGVVRTGFWERWTARVTRRPWVSALASAAVLLALAIPALSLEFGDGALRQFPEGNETRVGAELAAQELGAGASGPTQIVARMDEGRATDGANSDALAAYRAELRRDPEVAAVVRASTFARRAGGAHRGRSRATTPRARRPRRSSTGCARTRPPRWRAWRTSKWAAPPPSPRTSRTSCRARCGRSSSSSCCSAIWCCSCC